MRVLVAAAMLLASSVAALANAPGSAAVITVENDNAGNLGTIRGVVRDTAGAAIADASVAIFRIGSSKVFKQVTSSSDGSFLARIIPGTYTVLAVAQGFNPVTLASVEVGRASDIVYGFKLERAGGGNTLPEKRTDRNSSKWRIRAASNQRSIYQNTEGGETAAVLESGIAASKAADDNFAVDDRPSKKDLGQNTVVESYFGSSRGRLIGGVNFARFIQLSDDMEMVVAGQLGKGAYSPQRFEADLRFRPNTKHQFRLNASAGNLGRITTDRREETLGQLSLRASDEWRVKNGVILVLGFDMSRFTGAGSDMAVTPRFGLQYDIDSKTKFRTSYTSTTTEQKNWANAIDLEGGSFYFTEPVAVDDIIVEHGRPKMASSTRMDLGIERVLDNSSSIEGNVFFDASMARGVGLNALPFNTLSPNAFNDIIGDSSGRSTGIRIVYNRRLNSVISTAAGYSFGTGRRLSDNSMSDPSHIFEGGMFQTLFAKVEADLRSGTSISTVFRLSSDATVFAIDPFRGQLAIYDPGLSVFLSQNLPTLGLPVRVKAVLDARNIFDLQGGINGPEGSLRIDSQRRVLRGGIQLRF